MILKPFNEITTITEAFNAHNISTLKEGIDYKRLNMSPFNSFWAYIPLHWKSNIWLASSSIGKVNMKPLDWYSSKRAFQIIVYIGNNESKWALLIQKNRLMFNIYDSSLQMINGIPGIPNIYLYVIKPNLSIIK